MTAVNTNNAANAQSVMVVHENELFNKTISRFFESNGFEVISSIDFDDATRQLGLRSFDLILIDSLGASIDAFKLNTLARASSLNNNSRVYVLGALRDATGSSMAQAIASHQNAGLPLNFDKLLRAIKSEIVPPEVAFDVRLINAFVEAAEDVFEFYWDEKPDKSNLEFRDQGLPEKVYCTGVIDLKGDELKGSIGIGMTAPAVKLLAHKMFKDVQIVFDNEFIGDITGELCNLVLGRAKIRCAKLGLKIGIGLPVVFVGKSHVVKHTIPNQVASIVLGRGNSSFELQFVLSHQSIKMQETAGKEFPMGDVKLIEE